MNPKVVFYFIKKYIVLIVIGLILIYDLGTFVEYTIGVPQTKTKIKTYSKIEEVLEIEKNTELVQDKINQDKIEREEQKRKAEREEYEKHEIELAKIEDRRSDEIIRKYGIKKVLGYNTIDMKAKEIACEYLHCYYDDPLNQVDVYRFDFNDDGVDEIIGYDRGTCGKTGCTTMVLEKVDGRYKELFLEGFTPHAEYIILNHKTQGYYDFVVVLTVGSITSHKAVIQYKKDLREDTYL